MRAISNSRLVIYRRCRLKYYWTYVDKQPQEEAEALLRGKAAHKALSTYYKENNVDYAIADAWSEYDPYNENSLNDMLKLDKILSRYFTWAKTNDRWKVLEVEHTVEAEYKGKKIMGIWDLLIEKAGKKFIVDHKFQKSHSFSNLDVDSQVSHYLALAQLLGVKIQGLIYNIVNLEPGQPHNIAFRQITNRSPQFITRYLDSLVPQIDEMQQLEDGNLSVYPNWTKDCVWDCSFRKLCLKTAGKVI